MQNSEAISNLPILFLDLFFLNQTNTNSDAQTVPVVLVESNNYEKRLLFKSFLSAWNYDAVESAKLEDSLLLIAEKRPSIIILDLSAEPEEKNLEKIRCYKDNKISKRIPLFIISESNDPDFRNLSFEVGADEFLPNPVNFENLENLIQKTLEKKQKSLL